MSNAQQQTANKTESKADPRLASNEPAKSIAVAQIWLDAQTDLPGKTLATVLQATPREQIINAEGKRIANKQAWTIRYTPAHRHFEITHWPADPNKAEDTRMVHECHIQSWKPAA